MVPGPSRGGAGEEEGEETSGSENETRLVASRPPEREPGGLDQLPPRWRQIQWISKRWLLSKTVAQKCSVC